VRVLLIAEMANPEWTSVPLVGWSHAQSISRVVDSHLVTQIRNREAIERSGLVEGRDFTAIDSEAVAKWVGRLTALVRGGNDKGWTTATALRTVAYYHFEHRLWKQFGARIRQREFDLVHRITPLSPTIPSIIAGKCRRAGIPFILGPINGGVPWPAQFDDVRRREREWLSYFRSAYRMLPGYRSTLRNAAAIITASKDTLQQIPSRYQNKCVYIPENAIDPARFIAARSHRAEKPIKIVFVGRLVPYKGADMLIDAAIPLVRDGAATVEILGAGPEMERLRAMVPADCASRITLPGWVAHTEIQNRLAAADVFAFPSVREFGGGVVLEAMACGLVPIVVDYAGPAELVTDKTGFRVPVGSRAQIVEGFKIVLAKLAAEPSKIDTLSANAECRARKQFTWDAKATQTVAVYNWLLKPGSTKPDFPIPMPDVESPNASSDFPDDVNSVNALAHNLPVC
jgi:glycosyltransferase involved in cell wall biosynthesis